jgi:hypothetical protein
MTPDPLSLAQPPASRRLRIYAFDPSLSLRLDTAPINEMIISVPWEHDPTTGRSRLEPGPIGEYLEVIDVDPASGLCYPPVDLNAPGLLPTDGLAPAEGNPQFHQQMVYAVAMATIGHFERALGRVALWATHEDAGRVRRFVRRLRIYPHALRDQNAYYSPGKKALLFGYFPVRAKDAHNTPGTLVFSCLSHDIVAHEVTHALLDGVHPRFGEPTNPDVHAFHEAFADIVALFQHFAYPGILAHQIGRTRGRLENENMLAQLAQQFGQATGRAGALRDALGHVDSKTNAWVRRPPDARVLEQVHEPHARGAILVAAVFGAFLLVYRNRTADLYRIATGGTGVLPDGDIHPDLASRLAAEAADCAQYVLQMCIRAIDYCPPVDITFGDYLRAIVTAAVDLNPEDEHGYRVAIIESFRAWGIHPRRTRGMSVESLQWDTLAAVMADLQAQQIRPTARVGARSRPRAPGAWSEVVKDFRGLGARQTAPPPGAENADEIADAGLTASDRGAAARFEPWNLESDRFTVWRTSEVNRFALWRWLVQGDGRKYADAFGLVLESASAPMTVYRNHKMMPSVEVHAVRTALRRSPRGALLSELVVELTQRRRGYFDPARQARADAHRQPISRSIDGDFIYRAGCTILMDPVTLLPRRIIRTAGTVADDSELERMRRFLTGEVPADGNAFDSGHPMSLRRRASARREPFAALHRRQEP